MKKFFKKFSAPLVIALVVAFGLFSYFEVSHFNLSKADNYGPVVAQNTSAAKLDAGGHRVTDYGSNLSLNDGEGVRVRNSVSVNQNASVTFYSNYGRDGAFSWAQVSGFDRRGGGTVPFSLPQGKSLEYVKGSTFYQECNTSTNVCDPGQTIADDQWGETPLFQNVTRNLTYQANRRYDYYYDLKVVNEPAPAFNIHSTDEPTFRVRNVTKNGSFSTSISNVDPGDELEFYFYIHNNPRGSVARNVRVGVENWTAGPSNNYSITGFIVASNAAKVTGTVHISMTSNSSLNFENGSGNWSGWPTVVGNSFTNASLGDGIITQSGVQIGDQGMIDACWDFLSKAYFKARVNQISSPTPTPTVTPTPTPTATPTVTPTPTATPTTPPAGPTSSCSSLTASTTSGTKPLTVTFTGSGSDSDGSIQAYQFNFGDNSNNQDQIVTTANNQASHVYYNSGSYTANLIVKDSRGVWVGSGNNNCQVNINVGNPPQVLGATAPPALPSTGTNDVILLLSAPVLMGIGVYIFRKFKLI